MKSTYENHAKKLCRARLIEFIRRCFSVPKISTARVLCLAGHEGLEVRQVYDSLHIPRSNIVCLEKFRKPYNELRRRDLGVVIKQQTVDEFIETWNQGPFDIVSLDFTGQLATYQHTLSRLRARGLLDDHAIVFTNFCGAREAEASKRLYYAASQATSTMAATERPSLTEARSMAIHKLVRFALTRGNSALTDLDRESHESVARSLEMVFDGSKPPRGRRSVQKLTRKISGLGKEQVAAFETGIDIFLGKSYRVQAAESYRYVSDGGTPMHADMLFLHRIEEFDWLDNWLMRDARTLRQSLARMEQLTGRELQGIIARCHAQIRALDRILQAQPEEPKRIMLGKESELNPTKRGVELDAELRRARAIELLIEAPHLTIEDVARTVGTKRSPVSPSQVAAWKAHITMGTYPRLGPHKLEQIADREFRAGRLPAALSITARLVRMHPNNVTILHKHATILMAARRFQPALDIIEKSRERAPLGLALRLKKGEALLRLSRYAETETTFREILETHPRNFGACIGLADALSDQSRFSEARAFYTQAWKIRPSSAWAECGRAICQSSLGHRQSALREFNALVRRAPRNTTAVFNRGVVLQALNRIDAAILDYLKAIKLRPTNFPAWLAIGYCLLRKRNFEAACTAFTNAIRIEPDNEDALNNLGVVYARLNNFTDAAEMFGQAVKRYPTRKTIVVNAAEVLRKQGRSHHALTHLNRLLELNPDDVSIRLRRASVLLESKQAPEAAVEFEQAYNLGGGVKALVGWAEACEAQRNFKQGLRLFKKALLSKPSHEGALRGRARVLLQLGRVGEAHRAFQEGLRANPRLLMPLDALVRGAMREKAQRAKAGNRPDGRRRRPAL